jgi:RNA polymerase sigma-70 factor (ECF subfamily)
MVASAMSPPAPARAGTPVSTDEQADAWARQLTFQVSRGNEAAFRELHDRYRARVFRLAVVLGRGDEVQAQDLTQGVMLTAARKLKPLESEAHLWNWLARITRQHAARLHRKEQRSASLLQDDAAAHRPAPHAENVLESCLDRALLELPPEERELVEWFYFDGLSQKELAERLATSPKAISGRLDRARDKLRTIIRRMLSDET